ncbi:ankyrin repeat domain-containing protein [Demequina activiva]|uniref:Ankyrin repeat domain-containing protein n=1 Tax=Demequina activiva TaxID=1582364 RepID=A0A919UH83_9MICO|nr:ankyrin repeat domain-containing protein [Demequina activiva]GIG55149.1 hypothetical protein Dac01nite_19010 [Demequina activiva]
MTTTTILARAAAAGAGLLLLAGCSTASDGESSTVTSATASADPGASAAALDDRPLDEQLAEALRAGDAALVALAVEAGADPGLEVASGTTALMAAVIRDDAALVDVLLDAGADPAAVGSSGYTALHHAAANDVDPAIIASLASAGAPFDVFATTSVNGSPLHLAAYDGNVRAVQALIEAGAPIDLPNPGFGASAIFVAAFANHPDVIETLALAGANVNLVEADGDTALDVALASGHEEAAAALRQYGAATSGEL